MQIQYNIIINENNFKRYRIRRFLFRTHKIQLRSLAYNIHTCIPNTSYTTACRTAPRISAVSLYRYSRQVLWCTCNDSYKTPRDCVIGSFIMIMRLLLLLFIIFVKIVRGADVRRILRRDESKMKMEKKKPIVIAIHD